MRQTRVKLNKIYKPISPVKGRVLIAEPFLRDDCFSRSVVLIIDSSEKGHSGLVLNKPIENEFTSLFSKYGIRRLPVYCGGPVDEDYLFFLHNMPEIRGAVEVVQGLYVGGDLQEVATCFKRKSNNYAIKVFMGCSGWITGQLEDEVEEESWVVSDINVDVFDSENVWRNSLLALKDDYYSMWLSFPYDPKFN